MTFEEEFQKEFPLICERWESEAPYDMGEDLKKAFRECLIDKQRVREAIERFNNIYCGSVVEEVIGELYAELGL